MNWRYAANLSEGGQARSSLSYFDGALRARQTQTRQRVQGGRLTSETEYDREGRGRVKMLPAPSAGNRYAYEPAFNAAAVSAVQSNDPDDPCSSSAATGALQPYDHCIFDGKASPSASADSGAGHYYSSRSTPAAPETYVADGGGYPFAASEPIRDSTSRPRRAGSFGGALRLGGNHDTIFRYGTAASSSLRELFGRNVARASYVERNVQIDSNGQAHIAYLDRAGNAIVTALTGAKPTNLDPIAPPVSSWATYRLDENNAVDAQMGISRSVSSVVTTQTTDAFFQYALAGVEFNGVPADTRLPTICTTCRYQLRIRIADHNGKAVQLCEGMNRQKTADPSHPSCECAQSTPGIQPTYAISRNMGNASPDQNICRPNLDVTQSTATTLNSPVEFCAKLPDGEYEVVKELEVIDDGLSGRVSTLVSSATFSVANAVTPAKAGDSQACGSDCDTFCEAATGDLAHTTPAFQACRTNCTTPQTWAFQNSGRDSCDALQQQLDADMAPGGQLADDLKPGGSLAGATTHPEQCQVAVCRKRNPDGLGGATLVPTRNSDTFDLRMMSATTWEAARCAGYLNPLQMAAPGPPSMASCPAGAVVEHDPVFDAGAYAAAAKSDIVATLTDFASRMPGLAAPAVASGATSCPVPNFGGKTIWDLAADPAFFADAAHPCGRSPSDDEHWRMFRESLFRRQADDPRPLHGRSKRGKLQLGR